MDVWAWIFAMDGLDPLLSLQMMVVGNGSWSGCEAVLKSWSRKKEG